MGLGPGPRFVGSSGLIHVLPSAPVNRCLQTLQAGRGGGLSSSEPAASTFVCTSLVPFVSGAFLTVREIRLRGRRDFQEPAADAAAWLVWAEELVAKALL